MNRKTFWTIVAAISYVALTACSSNGKKASTTVIAPTSGSGQSATVNTKFENALVATVMTGTEPASGVMVTFTAPGNGASGTFANGTATETDTTNSSGVAMSSTFQANGTAGTYAVAASAPNASAVNFTLTNTAGPAAGLSVASGNNQSATVSTNFTSPLTVQVVDSNGNPVSDAGLNVTFTAPGSGASGTFGNGTATETDATNASGVATSTTFKANGTMGGYMVTASATINAAVKSVNFSLTNNPVVPAGLSASSGSGQSAIINTTFGKPLVAQVVDSKGNPVSDAGVSVTFTAPANGASGTFGNGTATETDTTNASGMATSTPFKANGSTGGYMVTASATINGGPQTANFSLTNTAGPAAGLSASSGSGQSATVNTSFGNPLEAQVVDSKGNPVSDAGVSVTFTAPGSGASGTFSNGTATETDTTNATGLAMSSTFKANGTAGGPYTVTASATISGGTQTADFSLTNKASTSTTQNFVFYLSGMEGNANNGNYNFLAIAGVVTINMTTGAVTGGVQDYNDGTSITSPQPSGDTITGGQLAINASGQGTLKLITNNPKVGVSGTETLGVQFVNADHALIIQFDGTGTSSGSLDLQTLPNPLAAPSGSFAFTLSGVDTSYFPVASGGVLTITGNTLAGVFDVNDNTTTTQDTAFSGKIATPSAFGRGTITNTGIAITINYYIIGPEAVRLIIVDTNNVAVGSSFGQGTTTFSNASVPSPAVFELAGNSFSGSNDSGGNDALGQFTTSNTTTSPSDFSGVAEIVQFVGQNVLPRIPSGTYSLSTTTNGYGGMTFSGGNLGDANALGIYMTDPKLNLNDPNNSSGGGGALLLVLGADLSGMTGVLTPQTDTSTSAFAGNYAVGMQNINNFSSGCTACEFDMVGQQTVTSGVISGTGIISDPNETLTSGMIDNGVTFSGTPPPDTSNPGRYSSFPLDATVNGGSGHFDLVIYQASGGQLYWLEVDSNAAMVGPIEQQGSLTGLPAVTAAPETAPKK